MPQFGFYMAGMGVSAVGRAGLLLAWNPADHDTTIADEIDWSDIALYSWIGPLPNISPALFKFRSKSPISIPAQECPTTLDGGLDRDFFIRFGVKPGGSVASLIADGWLDVYEGQNRIYGIAPVNSTVKMELAEGSVAVGLTEYSVQDRVTAAALEDPLDGWSSLMGRNMAAIEIWRDLMSPNSELKWSPL